MTILIDPESLTTLYSTSTTMDSDSDIEDTVANVSITATTVSTTLSTSANSRVYAEDAQRYVDSLSDDELCRFEQMLSQKEQELIEQPVEKVVLQKVKNQ